MYARESGPSAPVRVEGLLWLVAALFFGLADAATTGFGLSTALVAERSPTVGHAVEQNGMAAVLFLKLAVFAVAYALWRVVPRPHRVGVPLGLAILGVAVTGWNLGVLYIATRL